MIVNLTVHATRFNITNVDLVEYNGNPLTVPRGFLRSGGVNNLATLISSQTKAHPGIRSLTPMGGSNLFQTANNPVMWLTNDGSFVLSKDHPRAAVRTLAEHLDSLKESYPAGFELKVKSADQVGSNYLALGENEVVTFAELHGEPVMFKRDEAGKWVGFNRATAEWEEVVLHLGVDGQFRIETADLIHVTVTDHNGEEVVLHMDSEGWIHEVEGFDRDNEERVQLSSFELSDDNPIFQYLAPHNWERKAPVTAPKEFGVKGGLSVVTGQPGITW
ncbi:hypothetical protein D3C79_48930 [compost metagenome]